MNVTFILKQKIDEVDTVEELLLGRAQLKTIDDGYQDLKLDSPEWVVEKLSAVDAEINLRVKGELMRRLKMARARRSALRTADEKRKALDDEIKELESKVR